MHRCNTHHMKKERFFEAAGLTGDTWLPVSQLPDTEGLVKHRGYATLPELAGYEDAIAKAAVRAVMNSRAKASDTEINRLIRQYEAENGCRLHEHQAAGVRMIVNNNLCILTGGPGTGKTTTIRCAVFCCQKLCGGKVMFAAPTGKASRQITRSTGMEASTLHHLLGKGFDSEGSYSTFTGDILFVDESSMNDLELSYCLFCSVSERRKLVWIGDVDQIPSVGIGAVLRDLINSKVIPCTMLTKTFRQSEGELLHNIKAVRVGSTEFWQGNQFRKDILPMDISWDLLDEMIVSTYLKEADFFGRENVAVLLPYRQKGYCSDRVNALLQARVNGSSLGVRYNDSIFRIGDPVMQMQNTEDVVNGEVGKVVKVAGGGVLVAYGQKKFKMYTRSNLDQLSLAYAMSITKSQGSEYASVILVQLDSHLNALNRNILYTGMSRAKQKCTLFTQERALKLSAEATASERKTFLTEKIRAVAGWD